MRVITRDKCKELLGITDSTYDARIDAKIPYIDAKVKQITGNKYNYQIFGRTTTGSQYIEIYGILVSERYYAFTNRGRERLIQISGINNPFWLDDIEEYIEIGQLISGDGIPADAYIEEITYNGDILDVSGIQYDVPAIKLSSAATATNTSARLFIGINIAYQDIIAKGIKYLINTTNDSVGGRTVTSVGTVSYSDHDSKIDGKYGMPSWFVKAFPRYHRGH